MRVWTKFQSRERAKKKEDPDPLECIYCRAGYLIIFYPSTGGYFRACSWCHEQIETVDYENLIMIREVRRKDNGNLHL